MKIKFVYKLVKKTGTSDDRIWKSAIITGAYSLAYRIDEETKAYPGTTGILCFKTFADAKKFKDTRSNPNAFSILKCAHVEREKKVNRKLFGHSYFLSQATKRSRSFLLDTIGYELGRWFDVPDGTVCLNAVTPVEVVE